MNPCICENCMKEGYQVERNEGTPFPCFTVLGGLVGGIAGLIVGSVVLIPASLVVGLGVDVARCGKCGSDKKLYRVMIENDRWDTRLYRDMPFPDDQNPKQYIYDELEGKFKVAQDIDDSTNPLDVNTLFPDYPVDYEVSFDAPDISLDLGSFGPDTGGNGWGGLASESGDGGDSGGSASDGGDGGGES